MRAWTIGLVGACQSSEPLRGDTVGRRLNCQVWRLSWGVVKASLSVPYALRPSEESDSATMKRAYRACKRVWSLQNIQRLA